MAKLKANNTSGQTGVNWSKEKRKWHSKIGVDGRRIHIGYFNDIDDAARAYKRYKRRLAKEVEQ